MQKIDLNTLFQKLKKDCISIKSTPANVHLPLGSSKFGGKPHLPANFSWPYYEGTDYENIAQNRPLAFLAQINLQDIAAYDKEKLLPAKGFLYFFYELSSMTWGYDPKDKGSAAVYYFDEEVHHLHEVEFPKERDPESILPEFSMAFENKTDLPDFEEFTDYYEDCDWDDFDKARETFGYDDYPEDDEGTKLLGYADIIQNSMLLECEYTTNGIYCGDGNIKLTPQEKQVFFDRSKEWTLLFQMSTLESDDFELMFGDCGNIYFYIKKSDLAQANFDNIWLVLQCS